MTIYQRDRDFHQLFSEIDVDVIPLKFVRDITFFLHDGSTIVMSKADFEDSDLADNDIESIIRDLDFYEELRDLSIRIDYGHVEKHVHVDVDKILGNIK